MEGKMVSINIGKPLLFEYDGKAIETGIFKKPAEGPVFLGTLKFDGDGQADLKHHGGADKAVCAYCYDHYPYWEKELQQKLELGAFGENLTVQGIQEKDVHIGDIFELGEALVQITQPRQPCHKIAKRYDRKDLALSVQNTGYTGFYLRVLKEGFASSKDELILAKKHPEAVTVEFANRLMHHDKDNQAGLERILSIEELSSSWRETFTKRLKGIDAGVKERLDG
ncbi:MOSC domain-containing protein [Bacillus sp. 1P06AnD]|uniref:MOSC domain-containing protein n=1 Tax=Bacillus sp. 1P06AnD TaxID=3132208 RepID=UPI0039A0980C